MHVGGNRRWWASHWKQMIMGERIRRDNKMKAMWNKYVDVGLRAFRRYARETSGATLMAFALSLPVVVGAMGMSVDLARTYLAKERLSHALDNAALAGAGSPNLSEDELEQRVNNYFNKNYLSKEIGKPSPLEVEYDGSVLRVSGNVSIDATFMRVLGVTDVVVGAHASVQREVRGIEVVLVLDVTGSMSSNNNIGTLRTAAKNFVDIMCPGNACSNRVKIGLVPFATSVNVGPYGLGKTPSGGNYDTAFVNNPNKLTFNQSKTKEWWGCVLERPYPQDTQDAPDNTWRWDMYRYVSIYGDASTPNNNCNKAYILPLTDNKDTLKTRINALQASGNTLSNVGMVWGYRVLSPEFPFREGSDFDDVNIRKVILLMTDGDNNIGSYSAYGQQSSNHMSNEDLNKRLEKTCDNMKDEHIIVYTITFTSGIDAHTKGYFRDCATDENKYFDAPTQAGLVDAFKRIAAELSNLYIQE